ncbi:MAG: hypothetical protein HY908_26410 [Myxococcales bacterium]|nr:hypothetical protein [Myxococcales bacterium]
MSAQASVAASVVAAPAASAKPAGGRAALARADFNELAVELALPLFWVADRNGSGAVDPDEVVSLWGIGQPTKWVEGGKFTPAFDDAYAALEKAKAAGDARFDTPDAAEKKRRLAVAAELRQARPAAIYSDFRAASAEDRAIVEHVLRAAIGIEALYGKQSGTDGLAAQIPAEDTASRMLFFRNQGPWCEAPKTGSDPDCSALASRPPKVSGLYPASLQKDPKFCEALDKRKDQEKLLHQFVTVVEKDKDLAPVPYHVAYQAEMEAVSRELAAAAAAITSPGEAAFKAYLEAAAQAFLDDKWEPADEAWSKMSVDNSKWYLRIGPDETYHEPCSRKAGFHVSFARINQDSRKWQEKLTPLRGDMEKALGELAGAPYKAREVKFHVPDFIDIVLNAGDSRSAFGATIGQSLPNWGPVANEGRGRTVAMTNLYTDEDNRLAFVEQTSSLFCQDAMPSVSFEPALLTMSTVLHEAAHNLGPSHEYKVDGKKDTEVFGGKLASMLEELKAQTSALYFVEWLAAKNLLDDAKMAERSYARDIIWGFGHISRGMYDPQNKPQPYSQLASIQVGALMDAGAIVWRADEMAANAKDKGCFAFAFDKTAPAVAALEKRVLGIKARGDKADAEKLVAEYVDKEGAWADLRKVITERLLRLPKTSFVYAIDL